MLRPTEGPELGWFEVTVCLSAAGFFGDASGDAYSEFMKAANSLRDNYRFAHTTEEQLVHKYKEDGE